MFSDRLRARFGSHAVAGPLLVVGVIGFTGALAVPAAVGSSPTDLGSKTFVYGSNPSSLQVPPGVSRMRVDAVGAPGTPGAGINGGAGGYGARAVGELGVVPGQVLYVGVGGTGTPLSGQPSAAGGSSYVVTCVGPMVVPCPSTDLLDDVFEAGGGGAGGQGGSTAGGAGGGVNPDGTGKPGSPGGAITGGIPGGGGLGATLNAGGTAGLSQSSCEGGNVAGDGDHPDIGFGGGGGLFGTAGGDGADGYHGGGGGGGGGRTDCSIAAPGAGGGGGGSSYGPPGTTFAQDTTGAARLTLTPVYPPTARIIGPSGNTGTYPIGTVIGTSFECLPGTGDAGPVTCIDSTGSSGTHGHLDTAALGPHTYTIRATSQDGQTTTASVGYTVIPAFIHYAELHAAITVTRATVKAGVAKLSVSCTGGAPTDTCWGIIALGPKNVKPVAPGSGKRIAQAPYRVSTGTTGTVKFRLSQKALRALKKSKTHRTQANATITSGNQQTTTTLTLKGRG